MIKIIYLLHLLGQQLSRYKASHKMKKNLTIIQDRLPPPEKDNHRLLVGESEMLPKSAVHLTGQEDEND